MIGIIFLLLHATTQTKMMDELWREKLIFFSNAFSAARDLASSYNIFAKLLDEEEATGFFICNIFCFKLNLYFCTWFSPNFDFRNIEKDFRDFKLFNQLLAAT